ncbi:hypothetical protein Tel_03490 [Candidatus Tenderia electrophaga]|jgi:hypothetical protein|uniref:Potassium channel domain-containing protein n=1 Tax=Candidatus Tenderia electrophaga TaxID=1748243 RepID=A0A0S2TAT6_9GAMM|nr:hypothetical protein Tel_03490 [Candidatus Tenderia electrophaga]
MLVTLSVTLIVVVVCVILHYEALGLMQWLAGRLHRSSTWHRWHLSIVVCGLFVAHVLEVGLFGLAYLWLNEGDGFGAIAGGRAAGLAECIYFSFTNYTSLGYGDLVPTGPFRFMAGMEALTGLGLITWTASFMYLQMQRLWKHEPL